MHYFLDTEFNEDGSVIDLISIALVAEDGREYYACSTEARLDKCDGWVRAQVLPHLPRYGDPAWKDRRQIRSDIALFLGAPVETSMFSSMLPSIPDPNPVVWAWYGASDWVAFYQLWGKLVHMPSGLPKFFRELKQLVEQKHIPKDIMPPKPKDQHDALADARWNRDVFLLATGRQP